MRVEPREIRTMLQQQLPSLLARLLPQARIDYPVMTPLNPTRPDRKAGSFVVWTRGAGAGGFREYSPRFAASGDVIDLIAYVHNADRAFALAWARDFLGLKTMAPDALQRAKRSARIHEATVVAAEGESAASKRARANDLWAKARPIEGTLAETYLAARRVPLAALPHREHDLRFMPSLEYWRAAEWDRKAQPPRKVKDGPRFPAMVAAVKNSAGDITAVHCTFLRHDGSGKADIDPPKLMRGLVKGSAVRLTRGPSDLTPEEAAASGVLEPLIIAEGIETALSCAIAVPEARVWAATAFKFFEFAPLDHPCIDRIVIAADNDASARAEDELADAIAGIAARGLSVTVMRTHVGKDFNDLLRGDNGQEQ